MEEVVEATGEARRGAAFTGTLPGGQDLRLKTFGPADLSVRFIRLVRLERPRAIFLDGFASRTTGFWSP